MVSSMKVPEASGEERTEEVAQVAETATEGQQTEEGQQDVEPEVPRGVKRRLNQETAKQDHLDKLIRDARAKTKAREEELASIQANPGSAPAKEPPPKEDVPPEFPDIETFEGTPAEFAAAQKQALKEYREWVERTAVNATRAEIEDRQSRETAAKAVDAATKKFPEFQQRRQAVAEGSSPGLQAAISQLDEWDRVVDHLGHSPAELAELNDLFESNPARAIAQLGKLEDRLSAAVNKQEPEPKKAALPPPIPPTGGGTPAKRGPTMNEALDTGDRDSVRALLKGAGYLKPRKPV